MRNVIVAVVTVMVFWSTIQPVELIGLVIQYGLAGLATLGVALSAWFPRIGVVVCAAATFAAAILGVTIEPFIMTGVALFTVAERSGARLFPRVLLAGVTLLLLVALTLGVDGFEERARSALVSIAVLVASWVLGARTRQIRLEIEARSRAEERLALARDVHDALSHSLGTIGVLAGVTAHVSGVDEVELRKTLSDIEVSARSGMQELTMLLQHERDQSQGSHSTMHGVDGPAWSLQTALSATVETARRAGLAADLTVIGDLELLSAALRTTIHRVVQEAVTNAVRHAGAGTVSIRITASASNVEVQVTDDGRGCAGDLREGHGLTGMRERAQLLGGAVMIEDSELGGLTVRAEIPVVSTVLGQGAPR